MPDNTPIPYTLADRDRSIKMEGVLDSLHQKMNPTPAVLDERVKSLEQSRAKWHKVVIGSIVAAVGGAVSYLCGR